MPENLLKSKKTKVAPKKEPKASFDIAPGVVLVGTYKAKQLAWIKKYGIYNYPVKDEDEFTPEAFAKIKELWLYADVKGTRHCFAAEFVGKMTQSEFLAANPTYAKLGKPRQKAYYVFKTTFLDYGPALKDPIVHARLSDFGGRSAKVKKAIEQFKADGEFAPLAHYLPTELSKVPAAQLRVCESAVQMDFFGEFDRDNMRIKFVKSQTIAAKAQEKGLLTCVEICAGAGGQALGLERAGFSHVALVEYEQEYCDVLKNNHPEWNVICADVHNFDGRPYRGVDLLAGGVPCPPFSHASKQLGKDDERDLFPEALRLLGEIRPKAVMIENVRGLLDPKFDEYRTSILAEIDRLGYDAYIQLLHASDFGVPQFRPRVVIVGIRKDLNKKKFIYPRASKKSAPTVGEALREMMGANGWKGLDEWVLKANMVAPTIVGGSKKHGGPDLGPTRARRAWSALGVDGLGVANEPPARDFVGDPKLTKEMIACVQGFPKEWDFGKKKTAACRMIGNAFPPPVAMAVGKQIRRCLDGE